MKHVWAIVQLDCREAHNEPGFVATPSARSEDDLRRLRRELRNVQPVLIRSLSRARRESLGSAEAACAMGLAVIERDGSVLRNEVGRDLPRTSAVELLTIQSLLSVTLYTMPRDRPFFPLILEEFRSLSPESQRHLKRLFDRYSREEPDRSLAGWELLFTGTAHALVQTGRASQEVTHIAQGLDAKYPDLLRLGAINLLAALGCQAKSAVPSLRKLFGDESTHIRFAAACAIVQIEPGRFDLWEIASAAKLNDAERKQFVRWTAESAKTVAAELRQGQESRD